MGVVFMMAYLGYVVMANYFVITVMNVYELFPIPSLVLMVEQVSHMTIGHMTIWMTRDLCNVFFPVEIFHEELFVYP